MGGRADRRALRRPRPALHRHDRSGSRSPTAPTSTRSIRTPTTACTTSWSCTSPTRRRSSTQAVARAAAPVIYQRSDGAAETTLVTLPPDPIQLQPTYESALAAFEALPQIRVLFDNGAGTSPHGQHDAPATPTPASNSRSRSSRSRARRRSTWYLGPGGTLNDKAAHAAGHRLLHLRRQARCRRPTTRANTGTGGLWGNASQWEWNWKQPPGRHAVSYVSAPLDDEHDRDRRRRRAPVGASPPRRTSISRRPSARCAPTATRRSCRTAGCGRASASSPRPATTCSSRSSTLLEPIPTMLASDAQPMPANKFVPVVIPLYFEGHAYRAGSRIRVTIAAPNGTQPIWSFSQTQPKGARRPSRSRSRRACRRA